MDRIRSFPHHPIIMHLQSTAPALSLGNLVCLLAAFQPCLPQSAEPRYVGEDHTRVLVCTDGGAGAYEAFPDVCRLPDGRLQCIFYASYTHVGKPSAQWPNGGRISTCWSSDEGRTWTPASTLYDSPEDDRDPSITALRNGGLVVSFFTPSGGVQIIQQRLGSHEWSSPTLLGKGLGASSPVRELPNGDWILGAYFEDDAKAYGMTLRSSDQGRSWEPASLIDSGGQFLDAETDIIALKDGSLFAGLRGGKGAPMNGSRSSDGGKHWTTAQPLGFVGHCPYLHRAPGGQIVLAYRQPVKGPTYGTALRISTDEAKTWGEAVPVDSVIGAYPSMVSLKDGSVLAVYYEEGGGSNIRARKFRIEKDQVLWLDF